MMIKAVLFDVDGTLVDSVDHHARAWEDAFREFGCAVPYDAIRGQIGKGGDQLMPALLPARILAEHGEAIERRRTEIFRERYLPTVEALPGAADLIRRAASQGIRVALASSAKAEELAALKRIVGMDEDDMDAETSADDAERSKPHPDIFEAALAQMIGVSADESLVVGDTPYDAEAACKIGLRTIGFLSGGFPEEALRAAGCVAVYEGPAHLLAEWDRSPLGLAATNTD